MSDTPTSTVKSYFQKFKVMEISRDQLKGADYNPRKIGERQRRALKASLKQNGLLQPIVWNERTGNIVGGHQRINELDSLMRTKNYTLDVAVVNLSESEEVAANIALNNANTMGEFDFNAVQELSSEFSLNLETDLLFDRDDLLVSFGVDLESVQVQKRDAYADEELMQEIKDRKKEVRERLKETRAESGDYTTDRPVGILTLVFRDESQKKEFCASHGLVESVTTIHAETILDLSDLTQYTDGAPELTIPMLPSEIAMWERLKRKLKAPDDKLAIMKIMDQLGIEPG